MFARKLALVAVLLVATPAFGVFRSDLYMIGTDDGAPLANGGVVEELSVIELLVQDIQTWNYTPPDPGNRMNWIQLNFDASSPGLHTALAAGTWAWEFYINGTMGTEVDDSMVTSILPIPTPDLFVKRTAVAAWPFVGMDAPEHNLGKLTIVAPAYNPGGPNTYTVSLAGGIYDEEEELTSLTQLVGKNDNEFAGQRWGTMTLEDFIFTVTPEPATLALLAVGGAAMFIRRRR